MTTIPTTIEELLDYWPGNIPFKGSLVSKDGSCMCAQGQALHFLDKLNPNDLRNMNQCEVDKRIAELFGISRAHSVLLRIVNDRQDGAPTSVFRNPEQVLGDQAHVVLAFWRRLDQISLAAWAVAEEVAWAAAEEAARAAAGAAARAAAGAEEAARAAAGAAARAAAGASNEIQGAGVMRAAAQPFFFLPLFGFADPEAVMAADKNS